MVRKRILGVSEARLGLSVLTCLLVALGYVALQRVGGTGDAPPVEVRDGTSTVSVNNPLSGQATESSPLQVLPAQEGQSFDVLPFSSQRQTSTSPTKLEPLNIDLNGNDPLWPTSRDDTGRLPILDIQPPR